MRRPWALAGTALLLPGLMGCSPIAPRPMDEASLLRRGQSRIDGGVNVTVTALSAEESERLLGYDVAAAGIQPASHIGGHQGLLDNQREADARIWPKVGIDFLPEHADRALRIGAQPRLTVKVNRGVSGGALSWEAHFAPFGLVGTVPNLGTRFGARLMHHNAGRDV